jgi:hypothetical protein
MHLGYHELRNMLAKFREEREQRKMAPPAAPTRTFSGVPNGTPAWSGSGCEVTLKFCFLMVRFRLLTKQIGCNQILSDLGPGIISSILTLAY